MLLFKGAIKITTDVWLKLCTGFTSEVRFENVMSWTWAWSCSLNKVVGSSIIAVLTEPSWLFWFVTTMPDLITLSCNLKVVLTLLYVPLPVFCQQKPGLYTDLSISLFDCFISKANCWKSSASLPFYFPSHTYSPWHVSVNMLLEYLKPLTQHLIVFLQGIALNTQNSAVR